MADREELRKAIHRGIFKRFPISVVEAVGYTQEGYESLIDSIADEVERICGQGPMAERIEYGNRWIGADETFRTIGDILPCGSGRAFYDARRRTIPTPGSWYAER